MKMIIRDEGAKSNVLATGFSIIDVFGADLVQPADELVERLAVNHQTADAFGIVGNDVGCPYIFPVVSSKHVFSQYRILKKKTKNIYISSLPLQSFFAEEIAALQRANVLFLEATWILDGDFHLE